MTWSSWNFGMNGAIWIMVVYVYIYYTISRSVLNRICQIDPDYFEITQIDGKLPFGTKTSLATLRMIFDGDLPDRKYGSFVRNGLYVARSMFACYVPLAVMVLYLAW